MELASLAERLEVLRATYFVVAAIFGIFAGTLFFARERITKMLQKLPRSKIADIVLWTAALAWFFYHLCTLDEVDFAGFPRWPVVAVFMAAGILAFKFLPDLLGLRAIAVLTLFASNELLQIGYTLLPHSRVLAGTAYLLIIAALFVGASPYLLRDWISWTTAKKRNSLIAGTLFLLLALANFVQGMLITAGTTTDF